MNRLKLRKYRRSILPSPVFMITIILSVTFLCLIFYQVSESSIGQKEQVVKSINSSTKESVKEKDSEDKSSQKSKSSEKAVAEQNSPVTFFDMSQSVESQVNVLIEKMTLQEKVGQLLVVGFDAKQADSHITSMINEYKIGGVILYDRNMENAEQVAVLTNQLQNLAINNGRKIPLMISVDQEGGQIVRMKDQVSAIPSQQSLGQRADANEVYTTAYRTGTELHAMGINVNFAPVLDLSDTDSRSFGSDPEKASMLGKQVVTGLLDSGVVATLKHFPGNGRSNVDPHEESSAVTVNQGDLELNDIYPFKRMIEEVDNHRFFVMVTHIKYPAYDNENPASLSSIIIQDLLRKKLEYTGLVVTDDLEMGAVSKYYSYEELGYKAIEAGADLLLVCHTQENQVKVFNGIIEAVQTKKLSEERVNEAVRRVLINKMMTTPKIEDTQVDPLKAKELVG